MDSQIESARGEVSGVWRIDTAEFEKWRKNMLSGKKSLSVPDTPHVGTAEAAGYLGLTRRTVLNLISDGRLKSKGETGEGALEERICKVLKCNVSDVVEYIDDEG